MIDTRYVYGSRCTWHGPIQEIGLVTFSYVPPGTRGIETHNLPCCPKCKGPLLEFPTRALWDQEAEQYAKDHPEMPRYLEWLEQLRTIPCVSLRNWDFKKDYSDWEAANPHVPLV